MTFRHLPLVALALGVVALSAPDAAAGPLGRLRDRIAQRRATPQFAPCPCPPAAAAKACPACPAAAPAAAAPACPGGACPLPKAVQGAAPAVAGGGLFDRLADGPIRTRWLLRTARDGAADELVKKGMQPDAAKALVAEVDDETITTHVQQKYGAAVGEGRLEQFFRWLWDNREALIKFILSLLAFLGTDG